MRGFDPKTPKDYVVKDEQELPDEQQTIFKLKNLTVREVETLKNRLFSRSGSGKKAQERLFIGSQERHSLEMGLVGWENFKDQADVEIPFSVKNIDFIPPGYRTEIALEIRGDSELDEDEIKN